MRPGDRKQLGGSGEELVAQWLAERDFQILVRNYLCRYGELDIVARKKELIVFVEVKRRLTHYFSLSEVITPSKQRKILQAAKWFIASSSAGDCAYRFDVALIEEGEFGPTIDYVERAFTAEMYSG